MLQVPDYEKAQDAKLPLHQRRDTSSERLLRPGIESVDENQIQESLDNLDMLLANMNNKQSKQEAAEKLGNKYGIQVEQPPQRQQYQ